MAEKRKCPKDSPEVRAEILRRMETGESLTFICRTPGFPSPSTFLLWVSQDRAFADDYARAKGQGLNVLADEIVAISDDMGRDKENPQSVARDRLRIDARKWILCKLVPKVYGEKLDVAHEGGIAVTMTSEERLAKVNALISAARARKAES